MRFSAAFNLPLPQFMPVPQQVRVHAQRREADQPPPAAPARELPADLDQRVRETGEW